VTLTADRAGTLPGEAASIIGAGKGDFVIRVETILRFDTRNRVQIDFFRGDEHIGRMFAKSPDHVLAKLVHMECVWREPVRFLQSEAFSDLIGS
jgi:hypothetical protein